MLFKFDFQIHLLAYLEEIISWTERNNRPPKTLGQPVLAARPGLPQWRTFPPRRLSNFQLKPGGCAISLSSFMYLHCLTEFK